MEGYMEGHGDDLEKEEGKLALGPLVGAIQPASLKNKNSVIVKKSQRFQEKQ